MALKNTLPCKICGKEFVPCMTDLDAFNYKSICCSIGCGREYFKRVEEARNPKPVVVEEPEVKEEVKPVKKAYTKGKKNSELISKKEF